MRLRGRATQRLVRHNPAAKAEETCNLAKGSHRVGLMHQETTRKGQVERSSQHRWFEIMDVTDHQLHVLQPECRHD